nr:SdpA family antimicrobial peptide system protein [Brachybacterium halotolerans]
MKSLEVWPQGWAFFTKPPDGDQVLAYRETPDGLRSIMATPQAKPGNMFGLSRAQRAQGPELSQVTDQLRSSDWFTCVEGDTVDDCAIDPDSANSAVRLTDSSPTPTLCGDVVLAQAKPVDWSYREFFKPDDYLAKGLARVHVECIDKDNGDT